MHALSVVEIQSLRDRTDHRIESCHSLADTFMHPVSTVALPRDNCEYEYLSASLHWQSAKRFERFLFLVSRVQITSKCSKVKTQQ
jgi:hypothetical protein